MKQYEIVISEEVVATVKMDYEKFSCSFNTTSEAVEFIVKQHPEYKDCPNRWNIRGGIITFTFCSTGKPVMQEI